MRLVLSRQIFLFLQVSKIVWHCFCFLQTLLLSPSIRLECLDTFSGASFGSKRRGIVVQRCMKAVLIVRYRSSPCAFVAIRCIIAMSVMNLVIFFMIKQAVVVFFRHSAYHLIFLGLISVGYVSLHNCKSKRNKFLVFFVLGNSLYNTVGECK